MPSSETRTGDQRITWERPNSDMPPPADTRSRLMPDVRRKRKEEGYMIRRFLIVVVAALIASQAHADVASHRKMSEDLLKMLKIDKMMGPMYEQINKMQGDMISKMNVPEDLKEITKRHMSRVNDLVRREIGWDNLKSDFIDIYVDEFSESDIREMITFYKSPAGKKFIEKSPILMQRAMLISQGKVIKLMPEIERLTKDMQLEIEQQIKTKK
jgi:hypothetical protein